MSEFIKPNIENIFTEKRELEVNAAVKAVENPELVKDIGFKTNLANVALEAYAETLRRCQVPESDIQRLVDSIRTSLTKRNGVIEFANTFFAVPVALRKNEQVAIRNR